MVLLLAHVKYVMVVVVVVLVSTSSSTVLAAAAAAAAAASSVAPAPVAVVPVSASGCVRVGITFPPPIGTRRCRRCIAHCLGRVSQRSPPPDRQTELAG
jgi:hypothetical protein